MTRNFLPPAAASLTFVLLAGALAGCPGGDKPATPSDPTPAAPVAPADPTKVGTISGKIKFDGAAPARAELDMSGTVECHSQHKEAVKSDTILVKDGALQNAVVYVKKGLSGSFPAPTTPVVLDQKGCMYSPHVVALQANQPFKIRNSDPLLHNVHALPKVNTEFNVGMPTQNQEITKKFAKAEMVKFRCDVHAWMGAYVCVFDHPFFSVSSETGAFELKNVPAGTYTIEAWHEKLGAQTLEVTVGAGETKSADFTFKPAS